MSFSLAQRSSIAWLRMWARQGSQEQYRWQSFSSSLFSSGWRFRTQQSASAASSSRSEVQGGGARQAIAVARIVSVLHHRLNPRRCRNRHTKTPNRPQKRTGPQAGLCPGGPEFVASLGFWGLGGRGIGGWAARPGGLIHKGYELAPADTT